jgi:predicted NACHT family NTPase/WD40 repeat protein
MEKLKVFISSKMAELRDVREVVGAALKERGIEAFVYEEKAGARPDSVVETSLEEVENADLYVGLLWQKYGPVTVEEFRHAREHRKPCLIYIRDKDIQREKALENFLADEVYDLQKGVTYDYFDSAVELGQQVADNIMAWLVRRHQEMTAEIREARVSQDEIARLQAEVDRLQAASRESLPQGTPADYLAQQMRAWFETLGYRFESHEVRAEDYFEWIINVPARRGYDRILVHGIEGEAEMSDVVTLRQAVDEQRTDEGWLVAARRKSQAACDEVEKKGNRDLFCYTFDELLDEHADFSGYLDWLEAEVRRQGIDRMYISLACTKEEFDPVTKEKIGESRYDERNGWIDGYIDRWLDDPSKEHISILGEFGTGKTWFALHYAWIALQRYRRAKERGIERPRLPLVIPLRDYAKAVSVESLFSEFFFRKHEIPLPGYSAFEQLNRMGKLLLIFDGFDEMAVRVDRQKMINNFWDLAQVVVPGAKVILTCRTGHFPEAQEGRDLLSAELQASTAALTGESPQFEVLELENFDDVQIRQVLSLRAKPATVEQVMENPDLLDLARRPVMTEFILEALSDIEAGKPVDLARVYLYAVQRKMERDIKAERTFTSLADKLYFLCELSWEMLSTDQMSLNYRHFPDQIRRFFGTVVQEQKDLDHWHYDMMGQTMLIRNADGDYSPAHRSLLEFFVAYKLVAELGVLAPDFTELARAQSHLDASALPQGYTWSSYFRREVDEKGHNKPIPPLHGFVAEEIDHLAETVGKMPLTEAILDLALNMLDPDEKAVKERLWDVIEATRDLSIEEVGYIGGNAATLLHFNGESFVGAELAKAVLAGADFFNADLSKADLKETCLRQAHLTGCMLENTDLRNADLADVRIREMTGVRYLKWKDDGQLLASVGDDSSLLIWNTSTWWLSVYLTGHGDKVWCVDWHPNGDILATCGYDMKVIIWSLSKRSKLQEFKSDSWYCTSGVCFNSDGTLLASSNMDGTICIWDPFSGSLIKRLECGSGNVESVMFTPDNRLLVCGTEEGNIIIWSVEQWTRERTIHAFHNTYVPKVFLTTDGQYVLGGAGSGPAPKVAKVWEVRTGVEILELKGHTQNIESICCTSDKRFIATGSWDMTARLWEFDSGKEVKVLRGHSGWVYAVRFSPDNKFLASGSLDGTIRIWDMNPASPNFGQCIKVLEQKMQCKGMRMGGAKGLEQKGYGKDGEQTLGEFFWERGAIE